MQERHIHIYALVDPWTGEIFYIGKSVNPEERKHSHFDFARRDSGRNPQLNRKIREIESKGNRLAEVKILLTCSHDAGNTMEMNKIKEYARKGHPILNIVHNQPTNKALSERVKALESVLHRILANVPASDCPAFLGAVEDARGLFREEVAG